MRQHSDPQGPNRSEAQVPEASRASDSRSKGYRPLKTEKSAEYGSRLACASYYIALWHHSQVVRQRSAKPLFPSPSLGGASKKSRSGGMVDARDLKSLGGNSVRVRVPPSAPSKGRTRHLASAFLREFRLGCERSKCRDVVPPFDISFIKSGARFAQVRWNRGKSRPYALA